MTKEELAAKLTGREYGSEITDAEAEEAKRAGLVVVFGYSDDNVELRGAVHEEIGTCGGVAVFLDIKGLIENECPESDCPYYARMKEKAAIIETLWCEETGYSWTYKTDIPHATFEIMEDGEHYCRGIVFALADVISH